MAGTSRTITASGPAEAAERGRSRSGRATAPLAWLLLALVALGLLALLAMPSLGLAAA